jgi:hypothetical protein
LFSIKENLEYLRPEKVDEYFIDVIFKIIPKIHKPYKLLTISAIIKDKFITKPIAFICLKTMYYETYVKIFAFLNELFLFSPIIIHTDFESALIKAIKNCTFLKKAYTYYMYI